MLYDFSKIPPFVISKGFSARMIHSQNMTVTLVEVEAGSVLPEHSHFHEQVTNLLEGQFEFVLEGETYLLEPGKTIVIPSNAKHGGRAITACKILDVFQPVREDFKRGEVAYAVR
jgi:quercetin dioxygenase-like cupin family protein